MSEIKSQLILERNLFFLSEIDTLHKEGRITDDYFELAKEILNPLGLPKPTIDTPSPEDCLCGLSGGDQHPWWCNVWDWSEGDKNEKSS